MSGRGLLDERKQRPDLVPFLADRPPGLTVGVGRGSAKRKNECDPEADGETHKINVEISGSEELRISGFLCGFENLRSSGSNFRFEGRPRTIQIDPEILKS
jgi:hypothetical protein